MAEDLSPTTPGPEPEAQETFLGGPPRRPEEERVHRLRFAVAYLGLAVVAGIAIGAGILLADEHNRAPHAVWSEWHPTGDDSDHAEQIADFVAKRYTAEGGGQLVAVLAGQPPAIRDVPIRGVAIRSTLGTGLKKTVDTRESVMYILCGGGETCALQGVPTQERLRLLRRESLELALYSFKYIRNAKSVIVLLPTMQDTETKQDTQTTLFFERRDFERELDRPLELTLSRPSPITPAAVNPTEALTIERLTRPHLFQYEVGQLQDGSFFMVLAPIALSPIP